jgi:hypothetical protein
MAVKSTAGIYMQELRGFDATIVPLFTPDSVVDVGDFGSFEDGRFVKRGNVRDRELSYEVEEQSIPPFTFASDGKVEIGPSVKVPNPLGGELFKASMKFTGARAAAVSFQEGVQRTVRDADRFSEQVYALWATKKLPIDRVVIWSCRQATGGTVVVSGESDNEIEIMADAGLLASAGITLNAMNLGVTFGNERKHTYKLSSATSPLTQWVRLYKLSSDDVPRVQDAYSFGTKAAPAPRGNAVHMTLDEIIPD